jgi:hypothetical protein
VPLTRLSRCLVAEANEERCAARRSPHTGDYTQSGVWSGCTRSWRGRALPSLARLFPLRSQARRTMHPVGLRLVGASYAAPALYPRRIVGDAPTLVFLGAGHTADLSIWGLCVTRTAYAASAVVSIVGRSHYVSFLVTRDVSFFLLFSRAFIRPPRGRSCVASRPWCWVSRAFCSCA